MVYWEAWADMAKNRSEAVPNPESRSSDLMIAPNLTTGPLTQTRKHTHSYLYKYMTGNQKVTTVRML